jgi:hypothetical protein
MKSIRRGNRCKGRTKSGEPCGAAATASGLCFFHGNPNKASELGRKGGRQKGKSDGSGIDPLPKLDSARAVGEAIDRLIEEVYSGKTPQRVSAGMVPLLNLKLRVIEATDVQERLAKLEQKFTQSDSGSSPAAAPRAETTGDEDSIQ